MDYFPPSEVENGWRKDITPGFVRSLGLDPAGIKEFSRYNLAVPGNHWQPWCEHKGILVIKNGWIVGEWYDGKSSRNFSQYLAANGKTMAMMCLGILAKDGRIGRIPYEVGLHSPVYDPRWLPEGFPLTDPRKAEITFDHIFRHVSGICPESEEVGRYQSDKNFTRWVVGYDQRHLETMLLYYEPGRPEEFEYTHPHALSVYSSVAFQHLGLVIRHLADMPAHEFLERRLLGPIGIAKPVYFQPVHEWSAGEENRDIYWHTEGGVCLTPRDFARFAYLLMRDGRWDKQQIVPADWVRQFRLSGDYPNLRGNSKNFFGPQYPSDLFYISGAGSNWAIIVPSLDLIAIRTGRSDDAIVEEVFQESLRRLFAAVI